jgi:hypothetical protein
MDADFRGYFFDRMQTEGRTPRTTNTLYDYVISAEAEIQA